MGEFFVSMCFCFLFCFVLFLLREREREKERERERGGGMEGGRGRGRGRELWVFRSFFDFIYRWIGDCGMNKEGFLILLERAQFFFCFIVCSRLRSSRGVPGASPTFCDDGW